MELPDVGRYERHGEGFPVVILSNRRRMSLRFQPEPRPIGLVPSARRSIHWASGPTLMWGAATGRIRLALTRATIDFFLRLVHALLHLPWRRRFLCRRFRHLHSLSACDSVGGKNCDTP